MSLFSKKEKAAAPDAQAAPQKVKGFSLRKAKYPTKKTINLAIVEKSASDPIRIIPLFLLFLCVVGVFCKFCVIDMFVAVNKAEAEVVRLEDEKASYIAELESYPAVLEEYQRYAKEWMSDTESTLVDRLTVLELVDRYLTYEGTLSQISVQGTTISLTLSDITLDHAAAIVVALEQDELVESVTVYTASSMAETTTTTVTVTIQLTRDQSWTVPAIESLF